MRLEEVMESDFILLWADMDVGQALHLLDVHEADYVIIRRWEAGDYHFYYLIPTPEVRARLGVWSGPVTVKEALDLHEGDAAPEVEAAADAADAPDRAVVVRDGRPVGFRAVAQTAAPDPLMGLDDLEEMDPSIPANGGTLQPSFPMAPGTHEPATDVEAPETGRHLRVEVENHDRTRPLEVDQFYSLGLDIGSPTDASVEIMPGGDETDLFDDEAQTVDLDVVFFSTDFTLGTTGKQVLTLPRRGPSRNQVACQFKAEQEGQGELVAYLFKGNNFIRGVEVTLNVGQGDGAIAAVEGVGRAAEDAFQAQARQQSLVFRRNPQGGYDVVAVGEIEISAHIRPDAADIAFRIEKLRQRLHKIVYREHQGKPVYQLGLTIPDEVAAQSLMELAEEGWLLFDTLFTGDQGADLLRTRLLQLAETTPLNVQFAAQKLFVPWGLMYLADIFDPDDIDVARFMGYSHIVEQIPLQEDMATVVGTVDSQPALKVGVYLNTDVDKVAQRLGVDKVVEPQRLYWHGLAEQGLAELRDGLTGPDLIAALRDETADQQLLYVYSHAKSVAMDEAGGSDESFLQLSGDSKVSLRDLKLRAPTRRRLRGAPLVFLNACESAEMSPLFYDGFLTYFVDKGARGVIGTEADTPALLATYWADRFFEEFLRGQKSIGELFRDLRQELYETHNNILGLLYALYCDGDVHVAPGIDA